jgi:hypothetical protein
VSCTIGLVLPSRYNPLLADDKAEAVATTEDMLTAEEIAAWLRNASTIKRVDWIG